MEIESENKLNVLLQSNRFSELTHEEQAFVLSMLSEEKFEQYRRLLGEEELSSALSIEELTLRNEVKDTVLTAFKNKHAQEQKSPLLFLVDTFRKQPILMRAPIAFGVLAIIGVLIFNLNQNKEEVVVKKPVVSDVKELNENDSLKEVKLSPSVTSDSMVIPEGITYPNLTIDDAQKERAIRESIQHNPKVFLASATKDANHLEISADDLEKCIQYTKAGMNEGLTAPQRVIPRNTDIITIPKSSMIIRP